MKHRIDNGEGSLLRVGCPYKNCPGTYITWLGFFTHLTTDHGRRLSMTGPNPRKFIEYKKVS